MCATGGAGGKGTWGKLTEVYDEDGRTHDANDPNYDSIDEDVSSKFKFDTLLSVLISSWRFETQAPVLYKVHAVQCLSRPIIL